MDTLFSLFNVHVATLSKSLTLLVDHFDFLAKGRPPHVISGLLNSQWRKNSIRNTEERQASFNTERSILSEGVFILNSLKSREEERGVFDHLRVHTFYRHS